VFVRLSEFEFIESTQVVVDEFRVLGCQFAINPEVVIAAFAS
jgi:hypothetical protein